MQDWFSGHKTLIAFVYLGSSLSLLLFRMSALQDKVFLTAYFSHSAHWIYHATFLWPVRFLWRQLLLIWFIFPCRLGIFFSCWFQDSFLISIFCKLYYDMSWYWPAFVEFDGSSLCFLDLVTVSFLRLGKLSAIICSNKLSATFPSLLLGLLWYKFYYALCWMP